MRGKSLNTRCQLISQMRKKQTKVNEETINISDFIVSLTGLELGHNGCKKNKKNHKGQTRKIIKRPETLRHAQTERKSQVV